MSRLAAGDFVLETENRGHVRLWMWERAARRNALPLAAWELLSAEVGALARETADPESGPRCLVLYGRGGVFASGADLAEMETYDTARAAALLKAVERLLDGLERLPIPTVAAIEGAALGGGLELALACDLRLASQDARLGIPAARLGAVLTSSLVGRLARTVGRPRAADLLLSGRPVRAGEALSIGLVQRLAPNGSVLTEALSWAEAVARNAPLSVRMAKAALQRVSGLASDGEDEARFTAGLTSEDFREGARAFLEKRMPDFRGR